MNSKLLAALAVPAFALGLYALWPETKSAPAAAAPAEVAEAEPAPAPAPKVEPPAVPVELALAMEQKSVAAEFSGNGREKLKVMLMNKGTVPLRVNVPVGQMFESELAAPVVVVQTAAITLAPGSTSELDLRTA